MMMNLNSFQKLLRQPIRKKLMKESIYLFRILRFQMKHATKSMKKLNFMLKQALTIITQLFLKIEYLQIYFANVDAIEERANSFPFAKVKLNIISSGQELFYSFFTSKEFYYQSLFLLLSMVYSRCQLIFFHQTKISLNASQTLELFRSCVNTNYCQVSKIRLEIKHS